MTQHLHENDYFIILPDGRQLGYAEYGDPKGTPVLFCHGAPGSRLSIFPAMNQAAAQRGMRLIVPDRPGYGLSTFIQRNALLDCVNDVGELLNRLEIPRCKLIGFSMGSLHAFACAAALGEKIQRVAIVGAAAPMKMESTLEGLSTSSRELFALARADVPAFSNVIRAMAVDSESVFAAMVATMSIPDQHFLAAQREYFMTDFSATVATGADGVISDLVFAANPWGFSASAISCHVDLWIGSEDANTPPAMTRYMASVLSDNRVIALAGAGHCCLYTHWNDILHTLLESTLD